MYQIEQNKCITVFIEGHKSIIVAEELRKKSYLALVDDRTVDWQNKIRVKPNVDERVSRFNQKRTIFVVTNTKLKRISRIMFRTKAPIERVFLMIDESSASLCNVGIYPGDRTGIYEFYPDGPEHPNREIILPNFKEYSTPLFGSLRRGLLYYYPSTLYL